ncbi:unnamed protein product [Ascophyllum nodosum]
MARARAPVPSMIPPENEVLMEEMVIYAQKIDLQGMMQEYLRRVLLHKPKDPIAFLIDEIKMNPYKASRRPSKKDLRTEEEKEKLMDKNTPTDRMVLLEEVFQAVEPEPGTKLVSRAKLIIALRARPQILLERFPRHVDNIFAVIARMNTASDDGMTLQEFRENVRWVLCSPGDLYNIA